jgi:peptidoglycan/xylan/chitin deacetylase (PgdA/CDA1 family)
MNILSNLGVKYSEKLLGKIDNWPLKYFFRIQGLILGFHRVRPKSNIKRLPISEELEVTPEKLEEIINFFQIKGFSFISLDDFLHDSSIEKFVIMTFDDGYYDNFEFAYPVLRKNKIPHTIYISNSFIDNKGFLWWNALEELILRNNSIKISGIEDLEDVKIELRNGKEKQLGFLFLRDLIMSRLNKVSDPLYESLFSAFENELCYSSLYNMLDSKTLVEFSSDPLVNIGCHTVNHLNLSIVSDDQLVKEILDSKNDLEKRLSRPINHFSFPFGVPPRGSDGKVHRIIRENFSTCTSTECGYIIRNKTVNKYSLPRIFVSPQLEKKDLNVLTNGLLYYSQKLRKTL